MYIYVSIIYTHTHDLWIYIYKLLYPPASSQSRERPPPKKQKHASNRVGNSTSGRPALCWRPVASPARWRDRGSSCEGEDNVSCCVKRPAGSKQQGHRRDEGDAYMSADLARVLTMRPQSAPREALARRALVWKERVRGIRACARARAAIIFAVGLGGGMALMLFLSKGFLFSRVRVERS